MIYINAFDFIRNEEQRQSETIELIASENFVSDKVREATASVFTNKYCEGYPATRYSGRVGRYYGGCQNADALEEYCCDMWRKVFNTDYHVNVQPHSGSQANMAAYLSVLNVGDRILSMSLDAGGHLTHSSEVSFVSRLFDVKTYGVDENGFIDYVDVLNKAREFKPKLIVAGASSYSREIDYFAFKSIANEVNAYLMVDMAHPAGLIATGLLKSPFECADIITTTTHKTLRGPRGGLIFCKHELAKAVDSAVFPRTQGGPLMNVIAAKAVAAEECLTSEYKAYCEQVVKNSKVMAQEFMRLGYNIVSGGTDNHMFLLSLAGTGINGKQLQEECDKHGITLNKNAIPNDPLPPSQASGVRIGTAAMTTKGFAEADFIDVAHKIDEIIVTFL